MPRSAVTAHYALPDASWKLSNNQTLAVADAMGTEAQYHQALDEPPRHQLAARLGPASSHRHRRCPRPLETSGYRCRSPMPAQLTDRPVQDLAVYDTRMTVRVD